jgi:DNA repair photolyase
MTKTITSATHGRGTLLNPKNKFDTFERIPDLSSFEHLKEEIGQPVPTDYLRIHQKTIINRVDSPDVPFNWSMNPYQGCEHGCIYCYARSTHEFWGFNSGHHFEQKILVKENAPKLLAEHLNKPSWKKEPIMLSGNTDCYQPIERKLKVTRQLISVCLQHNQPLSIITKNALVQRDIDLLSKMAEKGLIQVVISLTTLDESLRRVLEPRTSSAQAKLKTIKNLRSHGIPVSVMMAPIIPSLNSLEIFDIAKKVKQAGAQSINYSVLRLNGTLGILFENWLHEHFPDRASKVLNQIKEMHGGQLSDHSFKTRMRGEGRYASIIRQQFDLAKKTFQLNTPFEFKKPEVKKAQKLEQLCLF